MKAIIIIASTAAIIAVAYGWLSTGPNCPGMDPSYIGWCK